MKQTAVEVTEEVICSIVDELAKYHILHKVKYNQKQTLTLETCIAFIKSKGGKVQMPVTTYKEV